MHRTFTRLSTGLFALVALAVMSGTAYAKNEKITICHVPPGNPKAAHSITISESAWPAHQAHGDSQGPCPEPPPGDDDDGGSGGGGGGNAGGGDNGGGSGGGNGGGGGSSSGSDDFAIVLCGERSDDKGRRIEVSNVGRVMVQETECQ